MAVALFALLAGASRARLDPDEGTPADVEFQSLADLETISLEGGAGAANRAPYVRRARPSLRRGAARGPAQHEPDPAQDAEGEPARPRCGGGRGGEEVVSALVHDQVREGIHADHRPAGHP